MESLSIDKYPKFLKCNDVVKGQNWNKFLLRPWVPGEIVKVAPENEQHSHPAVSTSDKIFRSRYVVVYRRNDEGKFTIKYTARWKQFDFINK